MKKRNKTKFNIFPGGDRVFIVGSGDDTIKVRVSSAVVSAASEVFAAMLSSGFKESEQKEITFSEEDPDVMLDFFHVVHEQAQNLGQRDGQRLIELAVMADMWMCAGALREWMKEQLAPVTQNLSRDTDMGICLPAPGGSNMKNHLMWEVEKHTSETYTCSIRSKGVDLSFDIKDLIEIAVVFGLDDLLWHASRISLAYSTYSATQDMPSRIAFPPKDACMGENSIHNIIAKLSRGQATSFVKEVWGCIDRDYDIFPFRHAAQIPEMADFVVCERASSLHDAMKLFLIDEKFSSYGAEYAYSLKDAVQSVGKLIYSMRIDYFSKKIVCKKCTQQKVIEGNGKCSYCTHDFQNELMAVIARHLGDLPGICRECYVEVGKGFFTSELCPRHG